MTSSSPLASGTVTIDASGGGTVRVGPAVYGLRWRVDRIVTNANASPLALRMYQNVVASGALLDTSQHGEDDTSEIVNGLDLRAPDTLIFVYSGGTPGTIATVTIWGEAAR